MQKQPVINGRYSDNLYFTDVWYSRKQEKIMIKSFN